VLLSRPAFGIQFNDALQNVFDVLQRQTEEIFRPLELSIAWLAHSLGIGPIKLQPWWHHTFVLSWLVFGAITRNPVKDGRPRQVGTHVLLLMWTFLAAATASIATGTQQLNSPALFWWPVASFFMVLAGELVINPPPTPRVGLPELSEDLVRWIYRVSLAFPIVASTAIAVLCIYFGFVSSPINWFTDLGLEVASPGLAALVILSLALATSLFILGNIIGMLTSNPLFPEFRASANGVFLDIVGAFGLATTLTAIGYIPMPS
jgi:hypothetical protein